MHLSNLYESFDKQTYSYEKAGPEYSVPVLYKYAQEHMALVSLPTETLVHNIKVEDGISADEPVDSPAFRRRAMKSDLAYPILVHKIDGKYWAIDGSHRIMKADEFKKKYMKAYVFVGNLPARAQVK
jgi:hypothetical protein